MSAPSAQFSLILRVELERGLDVIGRVTSAIGGAGGSIGAIDIVEQGAARGVREFTVDTTDREHGDAVVAAIDAVDGAHVIEVTDRTFELHRGGKIYTGLKARIQSRDDLSMAYTPGVARVCMDIHDDRDKAWQYTIKGNSVAVVSDGTAVLGLGDIGPEAAMPVMEGKAVLFKEFAGIDAWPICLATTDVDEIVAAVAAIAPGFGGINLEDISAPRCFEIESRLREQLDIPVFHDDQHGTAIVTTAAFVNALRLVGKRAEDVKVVLTGVGAAGIAVTDMLLGLGVRNLIGCDRHGAIHRGRDALGPVKELFADKTNPDGFSGTANEALLGADVFVGLSGPGAISRDGIASMADDAIVFAMANPTPEVPPEEIEGLAAVIATGRSDYPNQINNVLAFPGIFRGALDVRASTINEEMKLAAAEAIAAVVKPDELSPEYVIPSVFNREVAPLVAAAVAAAAESSGVARRRRTAQVV